MPWTWAEATGEFASYLDAERGAALRTARAYLGDLEEFRRLHAARRGQDPVPARVDIAGVRAYLAALFGKNDASSIARKLSSLRAFYRFLVKRGQVTDNPAAVVRSPKRRCALPRALTVDDTFRVVEAPAGARDRAVLEMLYGAGLRVSECCGLDLSDVDATHPARSAGAQRQDARARGPRPAQGARGAGRLQGRP